MEPRFVASSGRGLVVTGLLVTGVGLAVAGAVLSRRREEEQDNGDGSQGGGGGSALGKQLVRVAGYGGQQLRLRGDAAQALLALQQEAHQAGFLEPIFLPASGYRTRAKQEELWTLGLAKHGAEKVSTYVARPGRSAHETGRAVDLYLGYGIDSDNETKIRASAAYQWLADNAARLRWFPYKNEAWHWEFGAPHDPTGATYQAEIAAGAREGWLK